MNPRALWLLAVVLAGVSAAKAPPAWKGELTYVLAPFDRESWNKLGGDLSGRVETELRKSKLATLTRIGDGGHRSVAWSADAGLTAPLSVAEQMAISATVGSGTVGGEWDLLVQNVPVTVFWDKRDELSFVVGPRLEPSTRGSSSSALQQQFGVRAFEEVDTAWTLQTLEVVNQALGLMGPDELALIRDIRFVRARDGGGPEAKYTSDEAIYFYDPAFEAEDQAFVGEPAAPVVPAVFVALHEIAHAIADARVRELTRNTYALEAETRFRREVLNAVIVDTNAASKAGEGRENLEQRYSAITALRADVDAMQKQADQMYVSLTAANAKDARRVDAALGKIVSAAKSPTAYGRQDSIERFAECYALFKADPAALKRASPVAYEWFLKGEHLRIAALPLD